jgi:transcriptional regulator with XRE-family HTH domain
VSQGGVFGGRAGQQARQRLGRALRTAREDAKLTAEQLAAQLGVSQSSVSRYETGQAVPAAALVEAWAGATGIHPSNRAALEALREQATGEAITWRAAHRQLSPAQIQEEVAAMERAAARVRAFDPVLPPGVLQTAAYATAVYRARGLDGTELARAVAARTDRQTYLYEPGLDLHVVLGEAALRWRITAPAAHAAQLAWLAQLTDLDGLRLAVAPFAAVMPVWHSHGFTIFDLPDGPAVHVETLHAAVNVLDPDDVAGYEQAFEALAGGAVAGREAAALLRHVAASRR